MPNDSHNPNDNRPAPVGRPDLPEGQGATSQIQFRVTPAQKAAYVRAANRAGLTLAAWSFLHLNRESGYVPRGPFKVPPRSGMELDR